MQVRMRGRTLDLAEMPAVMGVLNVTPDSFSDGGRFTGVDAAVDYGRAMVADGAAIVDVGPESTRPGSQPVPPQVQIDRAVPVIRALHRHCPGAYISIDARLALVARAALEAGADMVNDVGALGDDPEMANVVRENDAAVVLMHRRGTPATMQAGGGPSYADVVGEVCEFLQGRVRFARQAGIAADRMVIDPGIGFGKSVAHNLRLLRDLGRVVDLGIPVMVGASRKSFIGAVLGIDEPAQRLWGSLACAAHAASSGARIIRAHDVRATCELLTVWHAIRQGSC